MATKTSGQSNPGLVNPGQINPGHIGEKNFGMQRRESGSIILF
jgi:hypothetical protein